MSHLCGANKFGSYGFDTERSLLVVPVRQASSLYLAAGENLSVELTTQGIATVTESPVSKQEQATAPGLTPWERAVPLRRLTITGKAPGSTQLNAYLPDRRPWIAPLDIQVVTDPGYRQAGGGGTLAPKLAQEIASLSFRDALIRVAKDQMNSKVGRSPTGGDGIYGLDAGVNWCGGFVHWCYVMVGSVSGKTNPFGKNVHTLASPQKAIGWALHNPDKAQLVRFEGTDPYGWSWPEAGKAAVADKVGLKQSFVDISSANPVQKGDVCLVRKNLNPKDGWKHVCMVLDPPDSSGTFTTIDGNQTGAFRPGLGVSNDCIGTNSHDGNEKLEDGKSYAFVFLTLTTI